MVRKVLSFLALAFVVFFLIDSPVEAATLVRDTTEAIGQLLSGAARSLSTFVRTLF